LPPRIQFPAPQTSTVTINILYNILVLILVVVVLRLKNIGPEAQQVINDTRFDIFQTSKGHFGEWFKFSFKILKTSRDFSTMNCFKRHI
jgi:hypothetical protein